MAPKKRSRSISIPSQSSISSNSERSSLGSSENSRTPPSKSKSRNVRADTEASKFQTKVSLILCIGTKHVSLTINRKGKKSKASKEDPHICMLHTFLLSLIIYQNVMYMRCLLLCSRTATNLNIGHNTLLGVQERRRRVGETSKDGL